MFASRRQPLTNIRVELARVRRERLSQLKIRCVEMVGEKFIHEIRAYSRAFKTYDIWTVVLPFTSCLWTTIRNTWLESLSRLFRVPCFPLGLSRLYAMRELPPSWFVKASTTWRDRQNFRWVGGGGGGSWSGDRKARKNFFCCPPPLKSFGALPRVRSPLQTKMVLFWWKHTISPTSLIFW